MPSLGQRVLGPVWSSYTPKLSEYIDLYSAGVQAVMAQKTVNNFKNTYHLKHLGVVVEASHFPETGNRVTSAAASRETAGCRNAFRTFVRGINASQPGGVTENSTHGHDTGNNIQRRDAAPCEEKAKVAKGKDGDHEDSEYDEPKPNIKLEKKEDDIKPKLGPPVAAPPSREPEEPVIRQREMALKDAMRENKDLAQAIQILEDEEDTVLYETGQRAPNSDDELDGSGPTTANSLPARLVSSGIGEHLSQRLVTVFAMHPAPRACVPSLARLDECFSKEKFLRECGLIVGGGTKAETETETITSPGRDDGGSNDDEVREQSSDDSNGSSSNSGNSSSHQRLRQSQQPGKPPHRKATFPLGPDPRAEGVSQLLDSLRSEGAADPLGQLTARNRNEAVQRARLDQIASAGLVDILMSRPSGSRESLSYADPRPGPERVVDVEEAPEVEGEDDNDDKDDIDAAEDAEDPADGQDQPLETVENDDGDEDDDVPITRRTRGRVAAAAAAAAEADADAAEDEEASDSNSQLDIGVWLDPTRSGVPRPTYGAAAPVLQRQPVGLPMHRDHWIDSAYAPQESHPDPWYTFALPDTHPEAWYASAPAQEESHPPQWYGYTPQPSSGGDNRGQNSGSLGQPPSFLSAPSGYGLSQLINRAPQPAPSDVGLPRTEVHFPV
ncbi:hypothetical protein GGR56DRAFT_678229 [Xylariaceae sp. FL0804]|nr:hypothetical protein GGR56DRAFT_678229 [Xylariaceae sp. FL0804]